MRKLGILLCLTSGISRICRQGLQADTRVGSLTSAWSRRGYRGRLRGTLDLRHGPWRPAAPLTLHR